MKGLLLMVCVGYESNCKRELIAHAL